MWGGKLSPAAGESWAGKLDVLGERVFRGRFLQQFAALFYKNGEDRCLTT